MANAQIVVTANTKQAEAALGRLNSQLGSISGVAKTAAAALTAVVTGSVIRNIVTTTTRFQDLRTSLASVAGGAREGAAAFEFVNKFATKTQFGVEALTQTYIKLQAAGIKPTEQLLTTFTDAAAVTTDQMGSLQAMTDLFARTTAGGLGLEDLNRLADRGLPVFDILEQKLGRNRLELTKLGQSAEGAQLILKALQDGINERFGGATASRINNVSTQFSNLKIAIEQAADSVGSQGFALALGQTAVEITNAIANNKMLIQEVGVRLTQAFIIAKGAIKLVIDNIKFLGLAFGAFFALKISAAVVSLAMAFGSTLVRGLAAAGKALKALTVLAMGNPFIAAAVVIAGGIEYLTGAFSKLFDTITGSDAAEATLDGLKNAMGELGESVGLNTQSFEQFFQTLGASEEEARNLAEQAAKLAEENNKVVKAGPVIASNYTAQADALEKQKKTFKEILADAENSYQLSIIALETDKINQELLKAELELGRELTNQELERLYIKLKETEANRQLLNYNNKILAQANDIADTVLSGLNAEQDLLRKSKDMALKVLKERYDLQLIAEDDYQSAKSQLEVEYLMRKEALEKQVTDRVLAYNMRAAKKAVEDAIKSGDVVLSETSKNILQQQGLQEKQEKMVADRIEFEKKSEFEKSQWAIQQMGSVFDELGKQNKAAFEASKAFNIANAIMNTYSAATKALATYPWPFGMIAAAAAVAAGLAQVAQIRSQQYSGRALGGPVMGGQSYIVGENGPEMFTPTTTGNITRNNQLGGGGDVNVNFTINTVDATSFDQLLLSRKGMIQQVIADAMVEKGRRF